MGVIVIGLGTPWSAGENFGCTWEHRQHVWERQRQAWEHLGAPATSLGAPRITVEKSGNNIFFGNAAGAPGNNSYYLSFNDY